MPAQQHLSPRTAVKEYYGRVLLPVGLLLRQKKLRVDAQPVSGGKDHLLWGDEISGGKVGGKRFGSKVANSARVSQNRRPSWALGVGMEQGNGCAVTHHHR